MWSTQIPAQWVVLDICLEIEWPQRDTDLSPPPREEVMKNLNYTAGVKIYLLRLRSVVVLKGKSVPLEAWSGPESSRKLRLPDFMTKAHDGGKVVSLTHRPSLQPT